MHPWRLALFLLLPFGLSAQTSSLEYRELAGTIVVGERILPVLKAGGEEYILMIQPQEPGAQVLKSGLAVIMRGMTSTILEPGQPKRILLRPYEVTIRGQTIGFRKLPEGTVDPWG